MAATIATHAETGDSAATSSHVFTNPSGIVSGDLLLMLTGRVVSGTITTPAGWTIATGNAILSGSGNRQLNAFYRIADGSEGASTTVTTSSGAFKMAAIILRITAWHGTTPPEGDPTGASNVGSTTPDPPSLNPSGWDIEDTLWIAVECHNDVASTVAMFPYADNNITSGTASGSSTALGLATTTSSAASVNPGTFTLSASAEWAANTFAVRPAAPSLVTAASSGIFRIRPTRWG